MESDRVQIYEVSDYNKDWLEKQFQKQAQKAKKLKVEPPKWGFLGTKDVPVLDEDGNSTGRVERFHLVILEKGIVVVVNGWELIAWVEHLTEGNIVRPVNGYSIEHIPERFRLEANTCDHCHTTRRRKRTYVLYNSEMRSYQRIGSSCLQDFLGGHSPEKMAKIAELITDLPLLFQKMPGPGNCPEWLYHSLTYLGWVCVARRRYGWLSRTKAYEEGGISTSERARSLLEESGIPGSGNLQVQEQDKKYVEEAFAWIRSLDPDTLLAQKENYLFDLRIICGEDAVPLRSLGLLASLVVAYDRELRKREQAAIAATKKPSVWLGRVGDKFGRPLTKKDKENQAQSFPALEVRLVFKKSFETSYGWTDLMTFEDHEGNRIKWFNTGEEVEVERGDLLTLQGTIKSLDNYRGTQETVLARVRVLTVNGEAV